MKVINFKKKLKKLPVMEQKVILEQVRKQPEMLIGEQKSLFKGFGDLPLFASAEERKQTKLF